MPIALVSALTLASAASDLRIPLGKSPRRIAVENTLYQYCGEQKRISWNECDTVFKKVDELSAPMLEDLASATTLALPSAVRNPLEKLEHNALEDLGATATAYTNEHSWYVSPSVGINLVQWDATNKVVKAEFVPAFGVGVRYKPPNAQTVLDGSLFAADIRFSLTQGEKSLDIQTGLALSLFDVIGFGYLPVIALPSDGEGDVAVSHVVGLGAQRGF